MKKYSKKLSNKTGSVIIEQDNDGTIWIKVDENDRSTWVSLVDKENHRSDLSVHLRNQPSTPIRKETRTLTRTLNAFKPGKFNVVEMTKGNSFNDGLVKVFYDKEVA